MTVANSTPDTGERLKQELAARKAAAILRESGLALAASQVERVANDLAVGPADWARRGFFRDTFMVTVVRDSPAEFQSLGDIDQAISTGDFTGSYELVCTEALTHDQARAACEAVGSDPSFFRELAENEAQSLIGNAYAVHGPRPS
ncbi:hypothetical protein [Ramlibacter sp. AN1133]|uniref:hypothetical protein n=1 Tax=Ramlibacter sp. AN1133 TaxID=3133429 RepID=UPI0030BEFE08